MDQPPRFIRTRPPESKAIPIINPDSGQKVPLLVGPRQPARTFPVLLYPTAKDSTANFPFTPRANTKDLPIFGTEEDSQHEDVGKAIDIYARPFIPESFAIINELDGYEINTLVMKQIDFGAYISRFTGLDFLLPISDPIEPPMSASFSLVDSIIHTHYELYFRYHLEAEIRSQQQENESYSLFGHDTTLSHDNGQTTCSFLVPGIRENSPYVEEDDIIQLRQLRYDQARRLLGMEQWLAPSSQFHAATPGFPAPGGRWRGEQAPGWTGIIYNARLLTVQRKEMRLEVRVHGLVAQGLIAQNASLAKQYAKFNVRFPVPKERYLPMKHVLPIIQGGLRQNNRSRNQYQGTHGVTNASQVISHTTALNSYGHPFLGVLPQTCHHWIRSKLFPIDADCQVQTMLNPGSFNRLFFDEQLNWEQLKAIESICSHNYGTLPYLISGPPGTGKTKTLVEVALQLLKSVDGVSHILFCAPSDPAADTIVQRISAHFNPTELLRLNRPSRTFAQVPGAVLPFCYTSQDKFDLPPFKQLMACKLVVTTCRDASLLLYSQMTNRDLYVAEYGLRTSIHPYAAQPSQVELHWTALLIDEAAQAMEPEALVLLSIVVPPLESAKLAFSPLFVMAGDEYQLGPRTALPSSPLKTSLFSRLFARPVYAEHPLARGKSGDTPRTLSSAMLPIARPAFANLIRNYRSHPAILAVPSALFYADTLEPEATDIDRLASWSEWRGRRWPVLFRENNSGDQLEADGGGWYNVGEAQLACWYAALLVQTRLVAQDEICIMAPFQAQVGCLRKTIRDKRYGSLWDIDIGPTEAFQGLERGVVILCTTRSKERFINSDKKANWGIIGLPNKMNVALTRAKFGLIVIGRREILLGDPNWKAFLDFCDRNGLVADGTVGNDIDNIEPTRLEKVLLAKERDLNDERVLRGFSQDDEMWTSGMQAAEDMESLNGYEYSDEGE